MERKDNISMVSEDRRAVVAREKMGTFSECVHNYDCFFLESRPMFLGVSKGTGKKR